MDSAGLHGLLVCMQEIARYDCAIQLRAISPEADTLLELARMDRLLQKLPSLPAQAPSFTIAPALIAEQNREGSSMYRGKRYPVLILLLVATVAFATTLKSLSSFDLPGPTGKRFDYLTIDYDDHYLLSAHLAAGFLYVH